MNCYSLIHCFHRIFITTPPFTRHLLSWFQFITITTVTWKTSFYQKIILSRHGWRYVTFLQIFLILLSSRKMKYLIAESFVLFQEVGLKSMRICVRDLSGTGREHDPLSVSYIVTGGKKCKVTNSMTSLNDDFTRFMRFTVGMDFICKMLD